MSNIQNYLDDTNFLIAEEFEWGVLNECLRGNFLRTASRISDQTTIYIDYTQEMPKDWDDFAKETMTLV